MSIRSMVTDYLDKIVEARFKRDSQGRLTFFPWGFGIGRIVTDASMEARLRLASRRLMIGLFVLLVPAVAIVNAVYQPTGMTFIAYLAASTVLGFITQLPLVLLSRGLPRSDERMSYTASMQQSLDRFGKKFLIFGLATSVLATVGAMVMMLVPSAGADKVVMFACMIIFAPLTALYAVALRRKMRNETSAR